MAEDWELGGGLISRPKAVDEEDLRDIEGDWEVAEPSIYSEVN